MARVLGVSRTFGPTPGLAGGALRTRAVNAARALPRAQGVARTPLRASLKSAAPVSSLGLAALLLSGVAPAPARAASSPDFAGELYPRLESHNCRACHNSSGVASETRLHFPESGSSPEVVQQFGLSLFRLVDRNDLNSSPLLVKPTNRVPHTGGPLIAVGSEDERLLAEWAAHLAALDESEAVGAGVGEASAPEPIRRLTHAQYDNTVRDLLGDRTKPSRNFPPEDFVNGYTNQASAQTISASLAEAYSLAAEKLARNAFRYGDENGLLPCQPTGPADRGCAEMFVRDFGMRAYRRPLDGPEAASLAELLIEWAGREGSFLAGAATVVEAMLQSPDFLFIAPDGSESRYGQFAIASRLSYALWDTLPDRELFALAAAGRLAGVESLERAARRMLDRPASREAMDRFFAQWMRFDRLLDSVKDRNLFRNYSREVAESMTEESLSLFRHLAWNDLDFRDLFSADYTFVDDFLTAVYAMPDPREPFVKTSYPEGSMRGGILGHGTFLAQTGKPVSTSPTERGLFIREHFLCQTIPPPPPGVDASLPPLKLGAKPMTVRETMTTLHASQEACASCHRLVDPIGFGFEHFDTIGAYRETEPVRVDPTPQQEQQGMERETHQLAIDPSGFIAGIADSQFDSPREAGLVLADAPACQKCVAKQLFRYVFGRHETSADADLIDRAYNRFQRSGFLFRELVLGLVVSPEFLRTSREI